MAKSLENRDIMLLVIAAAGDTGLTPVQLMKSMFLIGQSEVSDLPSDFYSFIPYNYGPFNSDVYRDAEVMVNERLVLEIREAGRDWSKYAVTQAGLQKVEILKHQVTDGYSEYIEAVVNWVKSLTFSGLLRAIYAKYPEMRENSVFQGV